jgi:pimeloyl-ACP methyl ester carboxylesterase
MTWAIRCSEQWARYSPDATAASGKGTYFVDWQTYLAQQMEIGCGVVPKGVVADDDGVRVTSGVPVLILNGDADPQDPPENVAGAEKELPNSLRITVPGQGHGVIQTGCLYKVAQDFVDSGTIDGLDSWCVQEMPLPPFDLDD